MPGIQKDEDVSFEQKLWKLEILKDHLSAHDHGK